jgi:hypothetical protein
MTFKYVKWRRWHTWHMCHPTVAQIQTQSTKKARCKAGFLNILLQQLSAADVFIIPVAYTNINLTRTANWLFITLHLFPLCNPAW